MKDDSAPSLLDPGVLSALLRHLERTDVEEFEVMCGDARLFLRRDPGRLSAAVATVDRSDTSAAQVAQPGVPVPAPLTGVFYRRPGPEEAPFVQVGDVIEPGTIVGLIETMKMYNDVTSDIAGEIVSLVAGDGDLVTAGQPLLYVQAAEGVA